MEYVCLYNELVRRDTASIKAFTERGMFMNRKDLRWVCNRDVEPQPCGSGVCRKILAYTDELMCVENRFEKGGVAHFTPIPTPRSPMWFPVCLNLRSTG